MATTCHPKTGADFQVQKKGDQKEKGEKKGDQKERVSKKKDFIISCCLFATSRFNPRQEWKEREIEGKRRRLGKKRRERK